MPRRLAAGRVSMVDFFGPASALIFGEEGLYSNQPQDPGGETKWGVARAEHPEITDAAWAAWMRADSLALLRTKYWDAHRCGEMPWRWALGVFDGEVNQGSTVKLAQWALGVSPDGEVGPATLAAMAMENADEAFRGFLAMRLMRYAADRNAATYEKGWFKRVVLIAQYGEHPPVGEAHA